MSCPIIRTYRGSNCPQKRRIWETWDDFTKVMKDPIYDMDLVIGGKFALEDYEEGFRKMRSGAPGKMFLYP